MQTYFSIISTPLNTILNEKVSVGLVMYNGEGVLLKFSYDKLALLKGLMSSNKYNFLKTYLRNLEVSINKIITDDLFDKPSNNKWANESYMSYLNRYSNNSLIFSEPEKIDVELSDSIFKLLYIKYIFEFEHDIHIEKGINIVQEVKVKLYDKIQDRVNLDVKVTQFEFDQLFAPLEVHFIGKNGKLVAGQTIDFEKKHYFLESDLSRYIAFTKAADYNRKNKGKFFVIGEEPSRDFIQQHDTWKNIKESNLVDYVDLKETEKIQEYVKDNDVQPLYEKKASE